MTYRTNRGYRIEASYSFSSGPSNYISNNNIHMEYTNNFVVSYSGGGYGKTHNNFNYVGKGSNAIGYNTKARNGFLGASGSSKGTRGSRGGGSGMDRRMGHSNGGIGRGKGISINNGQGREIGNKGQINIDMQNQFVIKGRGDDSLTEVNLAVENLNLTNFPQNQIIKQESTKLEIVYHKETILVKKIISKQEHLELIIKKVESLSKGYRKISFDGKGE